MKYVCMSVHARTHTHIFGFLAKKYFFIKTNVIAGTVPISLASWPPRRAVICISLKLNKKNAILFSLCCVHSNNWKVQEFFQIKQHLYHRRNRCYAVRTIWVIITLIIIITTMVWRNGLLHHSIYVPRGDICLRCLDYNGFIIPPFAVWQAAHITFLGPISFVRSSSGNMLFYVNLFI